MPLPPAFVVVGPNGTIDVPANISGGGRRAPQRLGEFARAIDGTALSTQGAEVAARSITAGPMPPEAADALRAAIGGGRFVQVGGWLLRLAPGALRWAVVLEGETQFVPTDTPDGPVAWESVALSVEFETAT